jgi:chromosomal replication initiator protein
MEEIWLEAQSNIEKVLTPQTFNTWIRPIKFLSSSNYMIELGVPNKFIQEWVVEKYMVMIQEAVSSITDAKYHIQFRISESAEQRKSDGASVITKSENIQTETEKHRHSDFVSNLNPKYTFENFVCGASNQFAHAAAQSVANNPATSYNPLFIYGGVGLGKTVDRHRQSHHPGEQKVQGLLLYF